MRIESIKVKLKERSYDILIGRNILASLGDNLRRLKLGGRAVVITNTKIKGLVGKRLKASLENAGLAVSFILVPEGETSKSEKTALTLLKRLVALDTGEKIFLIAFGGGVVGDLTGFVAAVYKRGIGYVQVPTTLLAQIDSSIGGKTAIDLAAGKNLVGSFYQPRLVFSDVNLLRSLGKKEIVSGLAEAIKYGVIQDIKLFNFIEKRYGELLRGSPAALIYVVERCSRIKARIVEKDEQDKKGIRIILNFGHTVGHAVEAAFGYRRISHGEAVAFGMVCAGEIANRLGVFSDDNFKSLTVLIEKLGLPTRLRGISLARVMPALSRDKKFIGRTNRFVLPVRIGKVIVKENIPEALIRRVIAARIRG